MKLLSENLDGLLFFGGLCIILGSRSSTQYAGAAIICVSVLAIAFGGTP